MENVTLDVVYSEIKSMKKELQRLESILVPEIQLSKSELEELKKLREEAKRELKEGKLIPAEDL